MRRGGFSLIELLIVVAIIGILVSIALPNFLEAQVRAKVVSTVSAMRTLGMALQMYAIDNGRYPPSTGPHWDIFPGDPYGIWLITTPIAYLREPPGDIFAEKAGKQGTTTCQSPSICWMYGTWDGYGQPIDVVGIPATWVLGSLGPNLMEDCLAHYGPGYTLGIFAFTRPDPVDTDLIGGDGSGTEYFFVYDPSNGTVSYGDLFRTGP